MGVADDTCAAATPRLARARAMPTRHGSDHAPLEVARLLPLMIEHVSCGAAHTVCSTRDGAVYSWGWG
jgi:hypothetical protein